MIRKLRWKVVWMNMLFVAAVLLAVFAGIFLSTRSNLERNIHQQLQQALMGDPQALRPGEGTQPCFVAEVTTSGTVHITSSSYYQLYDEQAMLTVVQDCLHQPEDSGILKEQHLRYLRSAGLLTVRIAFTDSTLEQATLRSLTATLLLIELGALAVLFVFSYLLSGVVTRPVGQAWMEQQRFLSDASHELKTPLTVILSSADLLSGALPANEQHYVDNIQAEGQRMKTLVEDMLTLSRAEGQGQQVPHTALDLSDLVTDAVLRFEPVAYETQQCLAYTVAPDLRVSGHAVHLSQLLDILLDNAVKYASAQSTIRLELKQEGRNARILVENEGTPIPPEKLPHLFDRFYRADESRGTTVGFGLGLSIAQAVAKEHHGTIRCESDSRSTRFYVTLPLCS
ncbi:MAG: HAMP domain-containing histidine kinase [Clostridiales bacterium]|nr:HAMP domain-containing histidine kinase [Candidatus Cacconaster stercorequi]